MAWFERGVLAALLLVGIGHADTPNYGRVETFQPGKKYNCVPTADHKAWDCSESGKAAVPDSEAKSAAAPASEPPAGASSATAPAPKASALPAYLTNAAAGGPARAPAPAAPTPQPQPQPVVEAQTAPATPAHVSVPESAAPAAASPPAAAPAPAPAPASVAPAAPAPPVTASAPSAPAVAAETPPSVSIAPAPGSALGNREFLALPASSYIVEIAHSASRADIAALHANLHLPLGELYELHLTRDGGDWWLLVWGHFGDIESARAARSDLPADAAVNAGWPRRIAPLQAEARKSGEL